MQRRISMAIASHLSDAQIEMNFNPDQAYQRMNFIKLLVFNHNDLNEEVSDDYLDSVWIEAAKYNRKKTA